MELLSRFELETSSLPTAMAIFFTYFPLVYSRFCSISFALRHSLKASFPCVPHLSVAGYVVKKIVSLKEAVHKLNEALCNSLAFHLCISPFIPIDFRLLFRYGHVSLSLPTAMATFFTYFPLVYSRFCSISFAFRHSLQTGFPYTPRLSVAGYVVRNPCGT